MSGSSLFITISPDAELKIGTCEHCVVSEKGRPERAWDPDGDKELDFDRNVLLAHLKKVGVQPNITEEYVCP